MEERKDRETETPVDGPGEGEPYPPEHPEDTNEKADDRAHVVEPDSDEASPRA